MTFEPSNLSCASALGPKNGAAQRTRIADGISRARLPYRDRVAKWPTSMSISSRTLRCGLLQVVAAGASTLSLDGRRLQLA
jgi:hypothetical protein